jgi:GNAT superfamily N-acetyltransferase
MSTNLEIRRIQRDEYEKLGKLMIDIYSKLEGFPTRDEQPDYYKMLSNIGSLNEQKGTKVLVAISAENDLVGGVVYFGDMSGYDSGGTATTIKNASGIRLLGVAPKYRNAGVGKALTNTCIQLAKDSGHSLVILHTTQAMKLAWKLYLKMGFKRSKDLDFKQKKMAVFGFKLWLDKS